MRIKTCGSYDNYRWNVTAAALPDHVIGADIWDLRCCIRYIWKTSLYCWSLQYDINSSYHSPFIVEKVEKVARYLELLLREIVKGKMIITGINE